MECKDVGSIPREYGRRDLIDTLWNVKAIINEGAFVDNWDLIDTLWNVK